jgi:hypothetical protein
MNEVSQAIDTLRRAGVVFAVNIEDASRHLSVQEAARRLDVSVWWLKEHLDEFPNRWRLPAGAAPTATGARNVGELRIPASDVDALARRMRVPQEVVS